MIKSFATDYTEKMIATKAQRHEEFSIYCHSGLDPESSAFDFYSYKKDSPQSRKDALEGVKI